jgi:hypothetical protein
MIRYIETTYDHGNDEIVIEAEVLTTWEDGGLDHTVSVTSAKVDGVDITEELYDSLEDEIHQVAIEELGNGRS